MRGGEKTERVYFRILSYPKSNRKNLGKLPRLYPCTSVKRVSSELRARTGSLTIFSQILMIIKIIDSWSLTDELRACSIASPMWTERVLILGPVSAKLVLQAQVHDSPCAPSHPYKNVGLSCFHGNSFTSRSYRISQVRTTLGITSHLSSPLMGKG